MSFEIPPPAENSPDNLNPSPEAPAAGSPGDIPLGQLPGMETDDGEPSPDITAPEDYGGEGFSQTPPSSRGADEDPMAVSPGGYVYWETVTPDLVSEWQQKAIQDALDEHPIDPAAPPPSLDSVEDAIDEAISGSNFEADTKEDTRNLIEEDIINDIAPPGWEPAERPLATEDGAEVKAFLDSVKPWDGRQPEVAFAEQKAAGALVAEAATEHLSAGRSHEGSLGELRIDQRVDAETGELFHVTTIKFTEDLAQATKTVSHIGVREIRSDQTRGLGAVYELEVGSDGVARRSSVSAETETEREATRAALQERWLSTAEDGSTAMHWEATENMYANAELEEAFGLRRQPIGMDEARRLARMMLREAAESES